MAQAAVERASTLFSWDRIAEDLLSKYEASFGVTIAISCFLLDTLVLLLACAPGGHVGGQDLRSPGDRERAGKE